MVPPEETTVEVVGDGDRQPAGAGRHRGHRAGDHRADRAGRHAAGRAVAPDAERRPAHAARPRPGDLAPPRAAGQVGARGGVAARVPGDARPGGVHRDPDAEVRGVRDRVRRQRVPGRLLRAAGVPRPEPAVLQAAAGGRLRAGLRGRVRSSAPSRTTRSGTWRSTSRSTPSSASSRTTATCCAVLREVLAGMVGAIHRVRRPGRGADRRPRAGGPRRDPGHPLPRRPEAGRAPRPTSPTWPRSTSGRSARGRWPSTAATSSRSRATRW